MEEEVPPLLCIALAERRAASGERRAARQAANPGEVPRPHWLECTLWE